MTWGAWRLHAWMCAYVHHVCGRYVSVCMYVVYESVGDHWCRPRHAAARGSRFWFGSLFCLCSRPRGTHTTSAWFPPNPGPYPPPQSPFPLFPLLQSFDFQPVIGQSAAATPALAADAGRIVARARPHRGAETVMPRHLLKRLLSGTANHHPTFAWACLGLAHFPHALRQADASVWVGWPALGVSAAFLLLRWLCSAASIGRRPPRKSFSLVSPSSLLPFPLSPPCRIKDFVASSVALVSKESWVWS